MKQNPEEFWKKFEAELDQEYEYPAAYHFKFIVPTSGNGEQLLQEIFDSVSINTTKRTSSSNKYVAITIEAIQQSAAETIALYKAATEIEGIISL